MKITRTLANTTAVGQVLATSFHFFKAKTLQKRKSAFLANFHGGLQGSWMLDLRQRVGTFTSKVLSLSFRRTISPHGC